MVLYHKRAITVIYLLKDIITYEKIKDMLLLEILKSIFAKKKPEEYVPDPPGRTFKRVDTGQYFGCEKSDVNEDRIAAAKKRKIDQIAELELIPMFIRYSYKNRVNRDTDDDSLEISSVHVVFQKEVLAKKWNMVHVTEISFTVNYADFEEFEKMSGASLKNDFRDLTSYEKNTPYKGEERRKEKR